MLHLDEFPSGRAAVTNRVLSWSPSWTASCRGRRHEPCLVVTAVMNRVLSWPPSWTVSCRAAVMNRVLSCLPSWTVSCRDRRHEPCLVAPPSWTVSCRVCRHEPFLVVATVMNRVLSRCRHEPCLVALLSWTVSGRGHSHDPCIVVTAVMNRVLSRCRHEPCLVVTVAVTVIASSTELSQRCGQFIIASLCRFSFPLCDDDSATPRARMMCRDECEMLENVYCKTEYLLARSGHFGSEYWWPYYGQKHASLLYMCWHIWAVAL